jgi:hypothetical protein
MEELTPMEELIGLLVMPTLFVVFGWLYRRRAARAFRAEAHCVACDGTDLEVLAPDVYACKACGYEGGEGRGAHVRERRNASFRRMDPVQRRKTGRRDLREARTLLLSGLGDLERAQSLVGDSLFEDKRAVGSSERGSVLALGTGQLLEAREKVRDAEAKLGISLGVAATANLGDHSDPKAMLFDNRSPQEEAREMLRVGEAMLRAVEAAFESLHANKPARKPRSPTA